MKKSHHQLFIWQKAYKFVLLVYKITRGFPDSESYALVRQLKKAPVSAAANIVKASERKSKKIFKIFLKFQNYLSGIYKN